MKKFLSLVFALVLCFAAISFAACGEDHKHEFKAEWSYDETYHWHVCSGDNCLEVSDKAEHSYKEGSTDCEVCGATKKAADGGVNEKEWEESVADQKFDNVTISYTTVGETKDECRKQIVKIADGNVYRESNSLDGSYEDRASEYFTGDEAKYQRNAFFDIFAALLAERKNFVYDKEKDVYTAPEKIAVTVRFHEYFTAHEEMTNGVVKFDKNGNLISFKFNVVETIYRGTEFDHSSTMDVDLIFADYGTTVITDAEKAGGSQSSSEISGQN